MLGGTGPSATAEPLGAGSGFSSFFIRSATLSTAIWNFALAETCGTEVLTGICSPRWFWVKEGELADELF